MERDGLVVAHDLPPQLTHLVDGYINTGVANLQSYEAFDVDGSAQEQREASIFRDEQEKAFKAGEVRNPILNNCPKFETGREDRRKQFLELYSLANAQALRKIDGVPETQEDTLLDELVALRMDELGFIETAALIASGSAVNPDERLQVASLLKTTAREIYGLPERGGAGHLLLGRLRKAENLLERDDEWGEIARYALDNINTTELIDKPVAEVGQTFLEYYEGLLKEACGVALEYAFAEIGDKDEYSPEEMKHVFDRFLEARSYDTAGWQTEIVENRTMCATVPDKYLVKIGDKRPAKDRTKDRVTQSLLHEVEIHVGRIVRGQKLGTGLAGYGLPGYLEFEEPFATAIEEIYSQQRSVKGGQYVLAIAVSAGIDGVERDFRDSFELLWRLSVINGSHEGKNPEEAAEKAKKVAYNSLLRIWRGMPTDVPGCVYPKDRVYYNEDVWRYLTHNGNPLPRADFLRLLQAKYDPREEHQDVYVRQLLGQE